MAKLTPAGFSLVRLCNQLLLMLMAFLASSAWAAQPPIIVHPETVKPIVPSPPDKRKDLGIDLKPDHTRTDGAKVIRGRVDGKGTINDSGTHVYEGDIAPGHSPGCITDPGNVILNSGARLLIEIGGTVPCTGFDQFTVQQSLTINGATLQVALINSYTPSTGQRFKILGWGSLTGSFGNVDLTLAVLPSGYSWNTTALYSTGELIVNGPATSKVPFPDWMLVTLASGLLIASRMIKCSVRNINITR